MKKFLSLFFVTVCAALAFFVVSPYKPAYSEEINLLSNGDFNETVEEGYPFVGWTGSGASVSDESGQGSCVRSESKTIDLVLQQLNVFLQSGKYTVRFRAKIKSAGSRDVTVGFADNNSTFVASNSTTVSNADDFDDFSLDLELSDTGTYEFKFIALGTVRIFVDDMELVYVEDSGAGEEQSEVLTDDGIQTQAGAELRTVLSSPGLRFKGKISLNLYNYYVQNYGENNVQVGMLIVPTDFLSDCEFSYEALSAAKKAVQICVAEKWNNASTANSDGFYGFNCAFINILPYNIDRKFSFRSFIRFIENDKPNFVYSEYSEENNARSVYEVAVNLHNTGDFTEEQAPTINYFCNRIEYSAAEAVGHGNNSFSLTISDVQGYFVLDYDRETYSLSDVRMWRGEEEIDFSGMAFLSDKTDITITFTVDTAETLENCPIGGKIYKAD